MKYFLSYILLGWDFLLFKAFFKSIFMKNFDMLL